MDNRDINEEHYEILAIVYSESLQQYINCIVRKSDDFLLIKTSPFSSYTQEDIFISDKYKITKDKYIIHENWGNFEKAELLLQYNKRFFCMTIENDRLYYFILNDYDFKFDNTRNNMVYFIENM